MTTHSEISYSGKPIATIASLAKALGVTEEELNDIREKRNQSYWRQEQPKPDGGVRVTYSVHRGLKALQKRILHRILRRVLLPEYLLGSRPNKSYLDNVRFHCGAKVLFGEDVASFYPSIRRAQVRAIFQHLFRFSPEVSNYLADLCTFDNQIPQGACTSGDLANLVLWRREPQLVAQFRNRGLRYTRFVDDVYVSSIEPIDSGAKTWIVGQLHRLFRLEGFSAKRKKHELATSGSRMHVHRVGINAGRPSISAKVRANLRAAVRNLESGLAEIAPEDAARDLARLRGQIARLKHLHPNDYSKLAARLKLIAERVTS